MPLLDAALPPTSPRLLAPQGALRSISTSKSSKRAKLVRGEARRAEIMERMLVASRSSTQHAEGSTVSARQMPCTTPHRAPTISVTEDEAQRVGLTKVASADSRWRSDAGHETPASALGHIQQERAEVNPSHSMAESKSFSAPRLRCFTTGERDMGGWASTHRGSVNSPANKSTTWHSPDAPWPSLEAEVGNEIDQKEDLAENAAPSPASTPSPSSHSSLSPSREMRLSQTVPLHPAMPLNYSRQEDFPAIQPASPSRIAGHPRTYHAAAPKFSLCSGETSVWLEGPFDNARDAAIQAEAAAAAALEVLRAGRGIRAAAGIEFNVAEKRLQRLRMHSSVSEPQLRPTATGFDSCTRLKNKLSKRFTLRSDVDEPLHVGFAQTRASLGCMNPSMSSNVCTTTSDGLPLISSRMLHDDNTARSTFPEAGQMVAAFHGFAGITSPTASLERSLRRRHARHKEGGVHSKAYFNRGSLGSSASASDAQHEEGRKASAEEQHLAASMLSSMPWLKEVPMAELSEICARSHVITAKRYTKLCYEGQLREEGVAASCFVLLSGSVRCTSSLFSFDRQLKPGACFAESALVGERLAVETALVMEPSRLLQVRLGDLRDCAIDLRELQRLWIVRTLQTVPIFRNLNVGRNLNPLSWVMTLVRMKAGEVVCEEGAPADRLFILAEGRVIFSRKATPPLQLLRTAIKRVIEERRDRSRRRCEAEKEVVHRDVLQEAWQVGWGGVGSAAASRRDGQLIPSGHRMVGQCNAMCAERPWFGELAMRAGRHRRSATATCSEECKVLVVMQRDFGAFFDACPNMKPMYALTKKASHPPNQLVPKEAPKGARDRSRGNAPSPEDDPYSQTAAKFGVTLQATYTALDPSFANPPPRRHSIVHSSSKRMVKLVEIEGPPPKTLPGRSPSGLGSSRNLLIAPSTLSKGDWDRSYDGRLLRSPSPTMFAFAERGNSNSNRSSPNRISPTPSHSQPPILVSRVTSPTPNEPQLVAPIARRA